MVGGGGGGSGGNNALLLMPVCPKPCMTLQTTDRILSTVHKLIIPNKLAKFKVDKISL